MITYTIRTDMKGKRTLETDAVFTTGDVQAYRLQFVFYDNGVYDATGCSLVVKGKRSDGVVVFDEGVVDALGHAFYDVKSSMYAIPGTLSLEVALLTQDGGYLTVKELIISVREGFGEGELAEDAAPLLTELHNTLVEAREVTEKARPIVDIVATEESRVLAETERLMAEEQRLNAETTREQGEERRVQSEAERIAAEVERQEAYRQMNNTFGNALKGLTNGAVVFMDDVSPVSHTSTVKVSGVENPSAVTLVQTGKNLSKPFDYSFAEYTGNLSLTFSNNLLTLNGSSTNGVSMNKLNGTILPPGTYTFSNQYISGTCVNTVGNGDTAFYFVVRSRAGKTIVTIGCYGAAGMMSTRSKSFTLTETTEILLYFTGAGEYKNYQSRIMLNAGSAAEPYEEYKETKYTVNADGTVDHVVLYHPYTSLLPDTGGAVVSCQYNKDISKVIEQLTNAIISLGGNV
ncbi:MAG: hypothetical protein II997_06710 [Clostridia bacterium]|nr:hypothetical protein [Clostridia bacterium]